jgi:hypothetical protein
MGVIKQFISLELIAATACRDHIHPVIFTAFGQRNDMITGQKPFFE